MRWPRLWRLALAAIAVTASTVPAACGDPWFDGWIVADASDSAATTRPAGGKPVVEIARGSMRWRVSGACVSRGLVSLSVDATAIGGPRRLDMRSIGFAVGERAYDLDRVTDVTGVDVSRDPDHPAPRVLYTIDRPAAAIVSLAAGARRALVVTFDQPRASADRLASGRRSLLTLPAPTGETAVPVRLRCGD